VHIRPTEGDHRSAIQSRAIQRRQTRTKGEPVAQAWPWLRRRYQIDDAGARARARICHGFFPLTSFFCSNCSRVPGGRAGPGSVGIVDGSHAMRRGGSALSEMKEYEVRVGAPRSYWVHFRTASTIRSGACGADQSIGCFPASLHVTCSIAVALNARLHGLRGGRQRGHNVDFGLGWLAMRFS
jgi:hypothetical protein